jgi:hypothetical protein
MVHDSEGLLQTKGITSSSTEGIVVFTNLHVQWNKKKHNCYSNIQVSMVHDSKGLLYTNRKGISYLTVDHK